MFRKILIVAMFATAAGYCFAATNLPQVVTSEVYYTEDKITDGGEYEQIDKTQYDTTQQVAAPAAPAEVPVWPIAGSDADVTVACESGACSKSKQSDNIRIVSKIGSDLVVENNFNLGAGRIDGFGGWSGGADLLHGNQIPVGFDDECTNGSEMPLLHREVLEDDGGNILTVSRSGNGNCFKYGDGYAAFVAKMTSDGKTTIKGVGAPANALAQITCTADGNCVSGASTSDYTGFAIDKNGEVVVEEQEIAVDISADAEPPMQLIDQVRSWVVANGQTLREVLQSWCDKEGWDLVWATSREYPIEASAVFKGRFVDVASALVRNFGRATPIPYAKFYKGNRVLVISTTEE